MATLEEFLQFPTIRQISSIESRSAQFEKLISELGVDMDKDSFVRVVNTEKSGTHRFCSTTRDWGFHQCFYLKDLVDCFEADKRPIYIICTIQDVLPEPPSEGDSNYQANMHTNTKSNAAVKPLMNTLNASVDNSSLQARHARHGLLHIHTHARARARTHTRTHTHT